MFSSSENIPEWSKNTKTEDEQLTFPPYIHSSCRKWDNAFKTEGKLI